MRHHAYTLPGGIQRQAPGGSGAGRNISNMLVQNSKSMTYKEDTMLLSRHLAAIAGLMWALA